MQSAPTIALPPMPALTDDERIARGRDSADVLAILVPVPVPMGASKDLRRSESIRSSRLSMVDDPTTPCWASGIRWMAPHGLVCFLGSEQ